MVVAMTRAHNFIFGYTRNNVPIPAYRFGHSGKRILILGGVHGDEVEGIQAAHGLLGEFLNNYPLKLETTLVPVFNIDGMLKLHRRNGHGVDLNRNLPTTDWSAQFTREHYHPGPVACSEPENQALVEYIQNFKPQFILSLHSWEPMLNINGDCKKIAQVISSLTGYRVADDIGYPTPGSLGTYAGLERNIPTLTYEVERNLPASEVIRIHVPAIIEGLKVYE